MPLIRCDYSKEYVNDVALEKLVKTIFDASAELCNYGEQDAQNKISIFNREFSTFDHSTASAEIEVLAKITEFDQEGKTRQEVRADWLRFYESKLVPLAQEINLMAPIIFTITFQDWEVIVVTREGSVSN